MAQVKKQKPANLKKLFARARKSLVGGVNSPVRAFKSVGGTPLLCAAQAGTGILLLSSWMVQQGIDDGTLQPLLPDWQASPYEDRHDEIHAVFRGGRFLKPQTRAFIDFLIEVMAPLQVPR